MKINFVTTNSYKFQVARDTLSKNKNKDIELVQYDIETPEIQEDTVEKVAANSALWVSKEINQTAVAMDVGFCIETLGGFPGPFIKFVNKWLQPNDILSLMRDKKNRKAYFIDALACARPSGDVVVFTEKTEGTIVNVEELADVDWTMDAIFIPNGFSKTLAEMSDEEKNEVWSGSAWSKLAEYIAKASDKSDFA